MNLAVAGSCESIATEDPGSLSARELPGDTHRRGQNHVTVSLDLKRNAENQHCQWRSLDMVIGRALKTGAWKQTRKKGTVGPADTKVQT